jgi:lysozyme
MKINQAGLDLLKKAEGLELEAYPDPASPLGKACQAKKLPMRRYREITGWQNLKGDPWTIGYGHTGADVTPGKKITQSEADDLKRKDLAKFEQGVTNLVKVPVNENQFSALVSIAYNIGLGNLGSSTLLKKLNAKDYAGASAQFAAWNKAQGQILPGLVKRRADEAKLFDTPVAAVGQTVTPSASVGTNTFKGPSDAEISAKLAAIEDKVLKKP